MKNFTSSTIEAWQVQTDDWIKVGGQLYRVKFVREPLTSKLELTITLTPFIGDPKSELFMVMSRSTKIVIHNQK